MRDAAISTATLHDAVLPILDELQQHLARPGRPLGGPLHDLVARIIRHRQAGSNEIERAVMLLLAQDDRPFDVYYALQRLCKSKKLTPNAVARLYTAANTGTRPHQAAVGSLLRRPDCPQAVIIDAATNDTGWKGLALRHQACPVDLLLANITSSDSYHLASVAANPNLPVDQHLALAQHRLARVRAAVAEQPHLDPAAAALLATDTRSVVLSALIKAGHGTPEAFSRAATNTGTLARLAAAQHGSGEAVDSLAMDGNRRVRRHAVRNPNVSDEMKVAGALLD